MQDKEFSMFFEIVFCYHPTEYDPIGSDGLYVKEVKKIEKPHDECPQGGLHEFEHPDGHPEIDICIKCGMKENP